MRKLIRVVLLLAALIMVFGAGYAFAFVVCGVDSDSPPEPIAGQPAGRDILEAPAGAVAIGFDEDEEPCNFYQTTALRNKYSSLGVIFSGPAALDGGGILDECGNFFVSGHSSPNFLAFNVAASFSDGGVARGPQTMSFSPTISHLQVNVGSPYAGTIRLFAFRGATQVDFDFVVGLSALQTLSVSGAGIDRVEITFTGNEFGGVLVVDDLAFVQECDYCLQDSFGYEWCLNEIKRDSVGIYMKGTCETDVATRGAEALYRWGNSALDLVAYQIDGSFAFMYNGGLGNQSQWVSAYGGTGTVVVNYCGSSQATADETEGPAPDGQ
ncbi:hypothetical protein DSCA_20220 [Desulfosarcina alkanivorans]|uniref:Uncharacterized protein n=1 Tax=Desulfosarcina alkanivorans TaxID=571177 RepID=A0A5K7YEZ1_9BACT|nr:hypothetical protein [Desulfosarcina alkanivorans]BBO68092.1 hypothetical protein DSCA_20220 [Desulfosarcina alkanivorans]